MASVITERQFKKSEANLLLILFSSQTDDQIQRRDLQGGQPVPCHCCRGAQAAQAVQAAREANRTGQGHHRIKFNHPRIVGEGPSAAFPQSAAHLQQSTVQIKAHLHHPLPRHRHLQVRPIIEPAQEGVNQRGRPAGGLPLPQHEVRGDLPAAAEQTPPHPRHELAEPEGVLPHREGSADHAGRQPQPAQPEGEDGRLPGGAVRRRLPLRLLPARTQPAGRPALRLQLGRAVPLHPLPDDLLRRHPEEEEAHRRRGV